MSDKEYRCPHCGSDNILCKLDKQGIFWLVRCDNCDHWFTDKENDEILGPIPVAGIKGKESK